MHARTWGAGFLLLSAVAIAGCHRSQPSVRTTTASVTPSDAGGPSKASPPSAAETQAAEVQIVIDNFTFSPAVLTVKPGARVTWVNHDDVPHTATSTDKPKAFDSRTLDTDDSFSFTFDKPGDYPYFCAVHPHMTGKIIVQ